MRITVLAGGVGAARFLRGLKAEAPDADITVIGNTGDDITLFGLHVSPDLDTVMYTLGGGISEEQGWGRDADTFTVLAELSAYSAGSGWSGPDWFNLGDKDFATHIVRTSMLASGQPLSAATAALCERWQPGVTLIPMTDDWTETHVVLAGGPGRASRGRASPGRASRRGPASPGPAVPCTSRSGGCGCTPRCPRPTSSSRGRPRPGPPRACSRRSPRPMWSCSRPPTRW
jgi:LPPG:FO 2-phospho-L-lactate transferase